MSVITATPVVDDLSADISTLFGLLDYYRQEQLLDHWQRLLAELRAERRVERHTAKRALPPRKAKAPCVRGLRAVTN